MNEKVASLYGGRVQVYLDRASHCYRVSTTDAKPDGVTRILDLVPKYLLPWVARVTSEYIKMGLLDRLAEGLDQSFILSLCEDAKKEHTRKKESAGDIGTAVHAFAEKMFNGEPVLMPLEGAPEYKGCRAFLDWYTTIKDDLTDLEPERIVYSERLFYCGTTDLFCQWKGAPAIFDLKTGSGFYEDQPLQLAAYAAAIEEDLAAGGQNVEIKNGWIIHIDKATGVCTPYHIEITPELKTDWEAVRIAWRAVKRNQERHQQIKRNQKHARY